MSFRPSECTSRNLRNREYISIRFYWRESVSDAVVGMKFCCKSVKKITSSIRSSKSNFINFLDIKNVFATDKTSLKKYVYHVYFQYVLLQAALCVVNVLTGINWNVISNTMQYDWSCINVFVAAVKHVCLQQVMHYRYILQRLEIRKGKSEALNFRYVT